MMMMTPDSIKSKPAEERSLPEGESGEVGGNGESQYKSSLVAEQSPDPEKDLGFLSKSLDEEL
eukprot:1393795-Karenia_brevis.AAC.1